MTISDKLDLITEAWNSFFLENHFCQRHINFSDEVKTNYYGDIIFMFNDTIRTLSNIDYTLSFEKSVLQTFGIMQVIYIQQDLLDELLYIFNLDSSTKEDKNPNRTIRNELIGHPIRRSRKENKLISSVIFGRNLSHDIIHYIVYSASNKYAGIDKDFKLQEILKNHDLLLHKYLDKILVKINRVLNQLNKKLDCVQTMIDKQVSISKTINFVQQNFGNFADSYHLYHQNYIDECLLRINEHGRYRNVLDNCRRDLVDYVVETRYIINDITKYGLKIDNIHNVNEALLPHPLQPKLKKKSVHNYRYEFSKLYEKDSVQIIEYFKKQFVQDDEVLDELNNMQLRGNVELEFYSSLDYLRVLLEQRGML